MLHKIDVLKNLAKTYRKTIALESLFKKVASIRPVTLLKRHFSTGDFL